MCTRYFLFVDFSFGFRFDLSIIIVGTGNKTHTDRSHAPTDSPKTKN